MIQMDLFIKDFSKVDWTYIKKVHSAVEAIKDKKRKDKIFNNRSRGQKYRVNK